MSDSVTGGGGPAGPGEPVPDDLLRSLRSGDQAAPGPLFEALYDELRRLAGRVRQGRASETLGTTALVHEVWIKLASGEHVEFQSRLHFFRLAALAMRQILVDTARERLAEKRGGEQLPVTFEEALHSTPMTAETLLTVDRAVDRLAAVDPRAARVVEYRFFAGLTVEETAEALEVSVRTVKRDWRIARAHLAAELRAEETS